MTVREFADWFLDLTILQALGFIFLWSLLYGFTRGFLNAAWKDRRKEWRT